MKESPKSPFNPKKYRRVLAEKCFDNTDRIESQDGENGRDLEWNQERAMASASFALAENKDRFNIVHCCSAGKTTIAAGMLVSSQEAKEEIGDKMKNTQDIVVVYSLETVTQTRELLEKTLGLDVGVWGTGKKVPDRPILMITKHALVTNRDKLREVMNPENISLVIGDEADKILTKPSAEALNQFVNATRVGLTATDSWNDGRRIDMFWGKTIDRVTLEEGIKTGICSPPLISLYQGDFNIDDLEIARIEKEEDFERKSLEHGLKSMQIERAIPQIYESAVSEAKAKKMPTLVYVPTVNLVRSVTKQLRENYPNLSIVGWTGGQSKNGESEAVNKTTQSKRIKGAQAFREGKIDILVLCEIGGRGMDLPNTRCVIDAYPTLSANKLIHRHGRGMRRIRPGTDLYERGFKKTWTHLIQVIPQANQFRAKTLLDVLDIWDEYQVGEVIDFKDTDLGNGHSNGNGTNREPVDQKEVATVMEHMRKCPVKGGATLIEQVDVLKEISLREEQGTPDDEGFYHGVDPGFDFFEIKGVKYATAESYASEFGVMVSEVNRRLKTNGVKAFRAYNAHAKIEKFYPEDQVREACADVVKKSVA